MPPLSSEERTAWLAGLKPGDKVAYQPSPHGPERIDRVEKITPTGRIVLQSGRRFTANGIGIVGGAWGKPGLKPVTPDVLDRIITARRRAAIETVRWDGVPADVIDAVLEILVARGALPPCRKED